ncbi:DUF1702 family protein [Kitasatospora sp. NPDC088351]|uniref:DUF1702 family protein n=1 Tax=unclassified Kitasatospora TaxID=2633591 RepID=UPI00343115F5
MAGYWRALRRRILTPDISETLLSTRGFHEKDPAARHLLENVGATFLTGYAYAAEARTPPDAERRLEQVPEEFRGFAYEGAAMALAMLDGLPLGGRNHVRGLLAGRGRDHVYMAYVGVGWAMARLPRFRWPALSLDDPLLRWLALDGYGFHQAYFRTAEYVHGHRRDTDLPWPCDGPRDYVPHAVDQGVGRACWFVGGADPERVADLLDRFPEERRPDLYSGAGLAATYAGGGDEAELRAFLRRAEKYRGEVAQGSVFAATARIEAGLVTEHTRLAARVLCGLTPEEAAEFSTAVRPVPVVDGELPAYEVWRRTIAARFASRPGAVV